MIREGRIGEDGTETVETKVKSPDLCEEMLWYHIRSREQKSFV